MRKYRKIVFGIVALIAFIAFACAFYIWNKPARDVTNESAIKVSAVAIFDSFNNNESSANNLFLNKAIEVTGVVNAVKKNQAGQTVVYLKSNDPMFGVNCTFKEDPGAINTNSTITFKGICTGYLSDVVLNQGIIVK
jgi:putative nucleic acid binding protein